MRKDRKRIRKRAGNILAFALFCSANAVTAQEPDNAACFTAVVTSDLHFTQKDASEASVPEEISADELARAFVAEVIDLHPDAWIITGDLTNSGSSEDVQALAGLLGQVKDAGIEVVPITGNHDFDKNEMDLFEEAFLSLPNTYSEDASSMSYSVRLGNVRLLAMDDAGGTDEQYGRKAEFSKETFAWLGTQLKEAEEEGETPVFLAHRSVLFSTKYNAGVDYTIRNSELADLLRNNGVQLCLTGHQHSQSILEANGLYEIISCMPLKGAHRFGWLMICGDQISYEGREIDIDRYADPDDADVIRQADELQREQTLHTVDVILNIDRSRTEADNSGLIAESDPEQELLMRFFECYENGTLGENAQEILEDPSWPNVASAIEGTNYGPWMTGLLSDPPRDAFHLEIGE